MFKSSDRLVKVQLRAFEEDLKTLQPIGLARVMRALAACMPASALCARLQITPSMTAEQPASVHSHSHGDAATGMKPWSFIVDGMLAESLWMVEMSASHGAQVTYNAVAAAAACMDRMVKLWHASAAAESSLVWLSCWQRLCVTIRYTTPDVAPECGVQFHRQTCTY